MGEYAVLSPRSEIIMTKTLFEQTARSADETERIGAQLAELIKANNYPRFVALVGGLGAGKTAFTRGFCSYLCPTAAVKSPSFALVNEYHGQNEIYHFDVWRITDDDDLYSTGFYDYLDRPGHLLCEWADNIDYAIPSDYIRVTIKGCGDEERHIGAYLITE